MRLRDEDGGEGMGYTYTVGPAGRDRTQIARDLAPLLVGREAERIEALWQPMWWALHYGGRGGSASFAISAVDIALWDLRARRAAASPSGGCWAALTRACRAMRAASTSIPARRSCWARRR